MIPLTFFLKTGTIILFQSDGRQLWSRDDWNNRDKTSAISSAQILSSFPSIPARPVALFSFIIDNRLRTLAWTRWTWALGLGKHVHCGVVVGWDWKKPSWRVRWTFKLWIWIRRTSLSWHNSIIDICLQIKALYYDSIDSLIMSPSLIAFNWWNKVFDYVPFLNIFVCLAIFGYFFSKI